MNPISSPPCLSFPGVLVLTRFPACQAPEHVPLCSSFCDGFSCFCRDVPSIKRVLLTSISSAFATWGFRTKSKGPSHTKMSSFRGHVPKTLASHTKLASHYLPFCGDTSSPHFHQPSHVPSPSILGHQLGTNAQEQSTARRLPCDGSWGAKSISKECLLGALHRFFGGFLLSLLKSFSVFFP